MHETELRKHRCCFTGHRPEKLKIPEKRLAELLEAEIKRAIDSGHTTFITGMAKGVDIVAAEIVLRLRAQDPRLKLICALPYPGFGQHWFGGWTERFQQVLAWADLERTICPAFSYASYQIRNEWMIRHSDMVIAVFNGEPGGTKNTLDFAKKNGVQCVIIDE
ncbi:MAG: DUF1273 domain-containing protein [Clostridiales bacterium]|nr:DUF1273 domain-containing protein [Clostridiales bacterium]